MDIVITDDLIISQGNSPDIFIDSTPENSIKRMLQKALETPKGYLSLYTPTNDLIDSTFGNDIYSDLSEPLTSMLLQKANKSVEDALSYVEGVKINSINISANQSNSSLSINVYYSINEQSSLTSIDIPL